MRTAICTISSAGHLYKTRALFRSLAELTDADFLCLVTDAEADVDTVGNISMIGLSALDSETAHAVKNRYRGDRLRWAAKPLLLLHLLDRGYDRLIYVDNDICFHSSPDFLFGLLDQHSVLLTPHFYLADPERRQYWLEANFRIGLFNAGFVAVNSDARQAVEWWARCCAYNVKKASWRGLFDDQRYLDMLPILFDDVHILKNRGCNVASWNVELSPRTVGANGKVLLDGRWPLVFIHFNGFTMRAILKGSDPLLQPQLDAYFRLLQEFNPQFDPKQITRYSLADGINYLRHLWWILIRKLD